MILVGSFSEDILKITKKKIENNLSFEIEHYKTGDVKDAFIESYQNI